MTIIIYIVTVLHPGQRVPARGPPGGGGHRDERGLEAADVEGLERPEPDVHVLATGAEGEDQVPEVPLLHADRR